MVDIYNVGIQGAKDTLSAPWVFSVLLLVNIFLLGFSIAYMSKIGDMTREIRILQIHVQDQTAVMLREGILKPGDATMGPTSGTN